MTLRHIGSFFIFIACTILGITLSRTEKKRQLCSSEYLELTRYIHDKIAYMHLPLSDIFASFRPKNLSEIGFSDDLSAEGLAYAYEKHRKYLFYESDMQNYFDKLGTLPLTDTVSLCSYEISQLEKEYEKQMELSEKKRKLYPSLGMLTGLIIVILLL